MNVSVIGLGFVGSAIQKSFQIKGVSILGYDKYKESNNTFYECLDSSIMFLCLPTKFNEITCEYDKEPIHEVCSKLEKCKYEGIIIIKSTVEPGTTMSLFQKYSSLKFIHNPEFLTAATAFHDFHNQKHIVLGRNENVTDHELKTVKVFYKKLYPDAEISLCTSIESESMKSFVNCFYSVKIQFFNELFFTCQNNGSNYDTVKNLMLKNKWINPMHTQVPGTDGKFSYGGLCFPKDTNALLCYMKKNKIPSAVLNATVQERNKMRSDNLNIMEKENLTENHV